MPTHWDNENRQLGDLDCVSRSLASSDVPFRTNKLLHDFLHLTKSRRFRDQHDFQKCCNGNITYSKRMRHRWAGLPCGAWKEGIWPPIDGNTKNGKFWLGHATYSSMGSQLLMGSFMTCSTSSWYLQIICNTANFFFPATISEVYLSCDLLSSGWWIGQPL